MAQADPFRKRLLDEIDTWRREAIISQEQGAILRERYRAAEGPYPQDTGRLIGTLSVLGSILVGVGAILFVASNWDEIPRPLRVALLFTATFSVYYVGWYMAYGGGDRKIVGRSLLFLGTLLYGASIMLIGQMYHVEANSATLVGLWLVGVWPFAYAFRSLVITGESVMLFALWVVLLVADLAGPYGLDGAAVVTMFMALGAAAYAVGVHHARLAGFAHLGKAYLLLGLVAAAGGMVPFTFGDFAENASWRPGEQGPLIAAVVFFVLVAAAGGGAALLRPAPLRRASIGRMAPYETGALLGFTGLALGAFFVPGLAGSAILFNVLLGLFIIGVILLGFARRDTTIFNLGLLFFVIDVMSRYFDFFWAYLDRSLAFIGAGLLLLGGGYFLERKRREVIARLVADDVGEGTP